jgi:uncharacterized membrane protein
MLLQGNLMRIQDMSEQQRHPLPTSTAELPELVNKNIELVVALHADEERNLSLHHRWVGAATRFFSRPAFLYAIVTIVLLWTAINLAPRKWKLPQFDPPPFSELSFGISFSALLVTVGVLIKQDRQEKLAEQRAQLSLQLSLLSEQKITKLIALIEELRRDLPNLHNRTDLEAEAMQEVADPHQVLTVLQDALSQELTEVQQEPARPDTTSKS